MDPALPFRQKGESQAMRQAITSSVVGGVLLLSAALAYGGGHIEASTKFLLAWGKGNCDYHATVATETVTVTVGGKDALIDVVNRKAEVALAFPFRGISSVRVDGAVTGVTVEEITVRIGSEEKKGKGTLTIQEKARRGVPPPGPSVQERMRGERGGLFPTAYLALKALGPKTGGLDSRCRSARRAFSSFSSPW